MSDIKEEKGELIPERFLLLFYMGIQYGCIYQDGKEKNNSLCSFVPGGATAVPCWELWALAC